MLKMPPQWSIVEAGKPGLPGVEKPARPPGSPGQAASSLASQPEAATIWFPRSGPRSAARRPCQATDQISELRMVQLQRSSYSQLHS
jgi:hypothetical protein